MTHRCLNEMAHILQMTFSFSFLLMNRFKFLSIWLDFQRRIPDSKVHGANMGPVWDRQDPGGPHVGTMNFAIWDAFVTRPKFVNDMGGECATSCVRFVWWFVVMYVIYNTCFWIWCDTLDNAQINLNCAPQCAQVTYFLFRFVLFGTRVICMVGLLWLWVCILWGSFWFWFCL